MEPEVVNGRELLKERTVGLSSLPPTASGYCGHFSHELPVPNSLLYELHCFANFLLPHTSGYF